MMQPISCAAPSFVAYRFRINVKGDVVLRGRDHLDAPTYGGPCPCKSYTCWRSDELSELSTRHGDQTSCACACPEPSRVSTNSRTSSATGIGTYLTVWRNGCL